MRMLLKGEAERAISGRGSKGIMYATALKCLKEQFGQPSVIARAVVNKLTIGERIRRNNKRALREFSLDIINCLSIMHRLNYYRDVNANDNFRFRAPNSRIREGNVLIDSGETTFVIRKDFAMALGLQGKRKRVDLAVVGGET